MKQNPAQDPQEGLSYLSELGHSHTPTAVVFEKASIWQRGIGAFIISLGPQQLKDNSKKPTHHSLTHCINKKSEAQRYEATYPELHDW